ncbi:MAG: LCP family protein [Candidatus Moraniibacteriota bacterium]
MKKRWKITILVLIIIPLALFGFTAGYLLNKIWQVSKIITLPDLNQETGGVAGISPTGNPELTQPVAEDEGLALIDEETKQEYKKQFGLFDFAREKTLPERGEKDRINVLVLGKAVPNYPGSDLTDTIILASINPTTFESSLLSIPRDLLVKIPDTNRLTKINAVYVYGLKLGGQQKGVDLLKRVITDITGQRVDYYAMVNFTAFEKAVDALGGVDLDVTEDIYDNRYPGPNYSYQTFEINKGSHHLDGPTALKYVRVRHNSGGDFGRARRQQQVIEAAKEKFFAKRGLRESLDFFNEMLKIVSDNVKTDIGFGDYFPFLFLLKDLNVHQVVNKVLDNSSGGLLENYNPAMGGVVAYALRPRAGNNYEIRKLASNIFQLDKIERQDNARASEKAVMTVLAAPKYATYVGKVENILRQKGYQVVTVDVGIDNVFLWQRKESSRLPAISKENRKSLTANMLIDKTSVSTENLSKTVIYDNAEGGKPFSLDDLSRRLDAQISLYKEPVILTDFVIFLGDNVKQIFQKDEGELFLTDQGLEQERAENSQ